MTPRRAPVTRDVDTPGQSSWLAKRKERQDAVIDCTRRPKRRRGHEIDAKEWGGKQHYSADGHIIPEPAAWGESKDLAKARVPLGEKRQVRAFTSRLTLEDV